MIEELNIEFMPNENIGIEKIYFTNNSVNPDFMTFNKKQKKCKYCKDLFTPYNSLQKNCFNDSCVKEMIKEQELKKWKAKKARLKKEMLTVQDYIKLAQQVFNSYIRERDKNNLCISCNKPLGKKFDAGHFYNANNHWNVRFDENNVNGQCVYCNRHLHGNLIEYGVNLEKKIGVDEFELLRHNAYETRKFTINELQNIIEYYKKLKKNILE